MRLRVSTPGAWLDAVLGDFGAFLLDHAACERKASATAMAFVSHYPDRTALVRACLDVAREELEHFAHVWERLTARGLTLGPDTANPYVARLARAYRKGSDAYFLDRLLATAIVEARGCERFGLVGAAMPPGDDRDFYRELARSEVRHRELYIELTREYFPEAEVAARLDELLDLEARIVVELPPRPALY